MRSIRLFRKLLASALLLASSMAQADIALLVHGYLGSPMSWEKSGVNPILDAAGWSRAGIIDPINNTIIPTAVPPRGPNMVFNIALPSTAPLDYQANLLENGLNLLESTYPEQKISLIGHSAGGLVARMALVKRGAGHVNRLITIASPNSGTLRAKKGLDITRNHGPFELVKEAVGGSLYDAAQHSRGLYYDLLPPRPGNALYWLNTQAFPARVKCDSLIHNEPGKGGDWIAPAFSQDLNTAPDMQGRCGAYTLPAGHSLRPVDGNVLVQILNG